MEKFNHFSEVPEDRTAVDNILRVNHGNQMRLGLMADAKANIMITVASVVFSVAIANLDNELVKWPLLTFAFGCFFALLFAIFAIIPKTDYPKDVTGDIDRKSPFFNPLFFGHFAHLPIDEYKDDYAETLMTDDSVYDALAGDIYGQGKVLALRKYKFLKWSYMSFLLGMISAVIVFVLQGPLGDLVFDGVLKIFDIIKGEITFTWDDVKHLLCQSSVT
ncbi:MAG: Pycsar system effector family protein, partial [Pseudomonadota bacterium]|nr:Pycsar system effector family protein [Pseudomonadota bacterium]